MHILCIWYGTVLVNTAVLRKHVDIICLPVHGALWWLCCNDFSSLSVVSHIFSVLCLYSKFRHHTHPVFYLCAQSCFFHRLHCWASRWRRMPYSINHPAFFDGLVTKACASEMNQSGLMAKQSAPCLLHSFRTWHPHLQNDLPPYILAYKPTIFDSILTFELWRSAYTRVMPHSQSRQSAWRLSVSDAHCVWATHGVDH